MFERVSMRRPLLAAILVLSLAAVARSDEAPKKGTAVPITFVPPPMENATYSVGIYEVKSGKLVRRLCEAAVQSTFTVGLNGLITSWDGKDDDGKTVPPGKYAARGYAVGPMKVEGVDILGNDWAGDDEHLRLARVDAIVLVPDDKGLAIVGRTPDDGLQVARYGGEKTGFSWESRRGLPSVRQSAFSLVLPKGGKFLRAVNDTGSYSFRLTTGEQATPAALDGSPLPVPPGSGQNGTTWKIEEGVLAQYSPAGERLRSLPPTDGEPVPVAVASSPDADRIYLLEETKGWQRVRGLSWVETKEENGKQVSTWQTFFERNIRAPDPSLGLEDTATAKTVSPTVEITPGENPLSPGKPERIGLTATFDEKGSYLAMADGLRLRQISQRGHLRAVKLAIKKPAKHEVTMPLRFFQTDGAAWDEFFIEGWDEIVSFDAGEFEMSTNGEKLSTEKPAEPDL